MDGSILSRETPSSGSDGFLRWEMSMMREGRCQSSEKPACIRSGPGGSQVPEEVRREPACHSGGVMVPSHHLMFGRQTSRLHQLTPAPPISGHIDRLAIYTCMCLFMPVHHPVIWESPYACRGTLSCLTWCERPNGWPYMALAMMTHASCSP